MGYFFPKLLDILVGIIISFFGFWVKSRWDRYHQRKALASAFYAEIESLQKQLEWSTQGMMRTIPNNEYAPRVFIMIDGNFFTIYDNNADKIGVFGAKTVSKLVSLYVDAKGLVATIKTWEYNIKTIGTTSNQNIEDNLRNYFNNMISQKERVFSKAEKVKSILQKSYL